MDVFERWLGRLSSAMNALATAWIGAIMFVAVADVLVREISAPLGRLFGADVSGIQVHGTHEIVRWSIVAIVFLQLPACLRMGKHIRSDFVLGLVPRTCAKLLDLVAHTLGLGVFAVIAAASWPNTVRAWRMGEWEGEGAIRFPVYPMRTILLFGSVVLALAFLARAVRDVNALLARRASAPAGGHLERPVGPS